MCDLFDWYVALNFRELSQLPSIAFLKTHKTGSTTLASILYRYALRHGVKVSYSSYPFEPVAPLPNPLSPSLSESLFYFLESFFGGGVRTRKNIPLCVLSVTSLPANQTIRHLTNNQSAKYQNRGVFFLGRCVPPMPACAYHQHTSLSG